MMLYKNIEPFTGNQGPWEEFSDKVRSQISAGSIEVANFMDRVESKMSLAELEAADYADHMTTISMTSQQVEEHSVKLHYVLMKLTKGEAFSTVKRCRDRRGLLGRSYAQP